MTEDEGKKLLEKRFAAAGFEIVVDFPFHEGAIVVDLDGWDATARVGYEYITREAGDDRQFTPETLAAFEERMAAGDLAVLLIDEQEAVTAETLDAAATGFLDEVARRRPGARNAR